MATKQEVLHSLSLLSKETLDRLLQMSDKLILPDEDLLVKVTFEQMVSKAHALADIYYPAWTDRSKADFGEFLIELFALFSEKDFWYINAFGNEGFSQKAYAYQSVFFHALRLGYYPRLLTPARGTVSVTFSASAEETIIKEGELQFECNENGLPYTNTDTWIIPASVTPISRGIRISQGELSVSIRNFNGKSIQIGVINASVINLIVLLNDSAWSYVTSFAQASAVSKYYIAIPNDTGFEIFFGDGVYGARPLVGDSITVKYLTTEGVSGNIAATGSPTPIPMSVKKYPVSRVATTAFYALSEGFIGGMSRESIEEMRHNSSLSYRYRDSIVSVQDAVLHLKSFPDIIKASAYCIMGILHLYVIPASGFAATLSDMHEYQERIRGKMIMGFSPYGLLTDYRVINELTVTAYVLSGYAYTDIRDQIISYLVSFTDPTQLADYGVSFNLSTVLRGLLQEIPGLQNLVFNSLNSTSAQNFYVSSKQILKKIQEEDITVYITQVSE